MEQEMTYTIIAPNGVTTFIWADTMFDAYQEALAEYGEGVMIRPSWYGEWDCGTQERAELYGGCYYDAYGKHHRVEKVNA